MKEGTIDRIDVNGTEGCTTIADLKLRMAEHIVAQYDNHGVNEAWDIIAETKAGAWRRPTLQKLLKKVFSAA
jgi:hypothetical protein